jgi:threonine dehydrogenase-like Zn-dependent dehydrogenase
MARLSGAAKVYAIDLIEKRCEMAKPVGADVVMSPARRDVALEIKKLSERKGVDVAIECSGDYDALREAIRSVRMAGRVVTTGYYQGGAAPLNLGAEWHHNRLTMVGSMGVWECPHRSYPLWDYQRMKETVLRLLSEKRVRTEGFITHEFPFEKIRDAYELIDKHPEQTIKVVITY